MPNLFSSFASHASDDNALQEVLPEDSPSKRPRRPFLLKNIRGWRRHHDDQTDESSMPQTAPTELANIPEYFPQRRPSLPENVPCKRAIPSLPRPLTFRRQESERREKLLPVESTVDERRALSSELRRGRGGSPPQRTRSPHSVPLLATSAPEVDLLEPRVPALSEARRTVDASLPNHWRSNLPPLEIPGSDDVSVPVNCNDCESEPDASSLREEFERRWILNLSMHFRDKSNREKFFVTYAALPNQWRRLTVSLDYRNAPANSLEADLSTLSYQRDKSLRIYEAIRESLADIQFYDTVTNLKLETTPEDGQLHVYVREDTNETIQYPALSLFDHIRCPRVNEKGVDLDSHLSGFVYRVRIGDRLVIKKEIPGPDTIDEFLYEVNALDSLLGCDNVVQLEGLVTDDRGELVKGLLISYASQGPLVDMIYDLRGTSQLQWHRREKWARQIVSGLADIHEAGYVQGDFTLSNIVIDEDDNAIIIDINRRGCPVGWEPPELSRLIDSGQRIGMCIGVKTDLFQLGMVLWALAEEVDEPERVERPLPSVAGDVPDYYRKIVKTCLRERPQGRVSANELLRQFPETAGLPPVPRSYVEFHHDVPQSNSSAKKHRSDKEYIDPKMAVTIDDVKDRRREEPAVSQVGSDQVIYVDPHSNPASTSYHFGSSGSWIVGRRSRGRSPVSSRRRRSSPYGRSVSSATSLSGDSPRRRTDPTETSAEPEKISQRATTSGSPLRSAEPRDEPSNDCPVTKDELAASLRNRVAFQHTDSGFDETMEHALDGGGLPAQRDERADMASPSSYHTPTYVPADTDFDHRPRTLSHAGAQLETTRVCDERYINNDVNDCCIYKQHESLDGAETS